AGLLVEPDLVAEALHRVLDLTVGLGLLQAVLTALGLGDQLLELAALLVGVLTPGLLGVGRDVAGLGQVSPKLILDLLDSHFGLRSESVQFKIEKLDLGAQTLDGDPGLGGPGLLRAGGGLDGGLGLGGLGGLG